MPIFEFICQKCGKEFERLVFRSDEAVQCPECGQESVNKLMSTCSAKVGAKWGINLPPAPSRPAPAAAVHPTPAAPAIKESL